MDNDSLPDISDDDNIEDETIWSIEDYEDDLEMKRELRRMESRNAPCVRNWRSSSSRESSPRPQPKKNDKKPPEKQRCRPRSRSRLRTSSRSPSPSPSHSPSVSRSRSRRQNLGQSTSPRLQDSSPPPRKSRSRSPLSRPRSRNRSVATETANLYNQNKSLEPSATTDADDTFESESCLEVFMSAFRNIHRSITIINRINRNTARQYNINNIWSGFDTNSTFRMVTKWLRSVNAYWYLFDWDITQTVFYAMAELSKCAKRWAAEHSTAHYKWKHWQAKVVLVFAAYQNFGSLLPEMIYKTSDDEETLEDYYHGKVLALYRCGIEGTRAVECIIHGICDDDIRNGAKNSDLKYPEDVLLYLRKVEASNCQQRAAG